MAKASISNKQAEYTVKHRAVCEDDSFKGSWRDSVTEAKRDAAKHRSETGNQFHVIKIITQQTLYMVYEE